MLVNALERKAKAAGGELIEVPTRTTRLSQFDHTTGQYVKKPLSQREHVFGDGSTAPIQRDLYSAFLVFCVTANISISAEFHQLGQVRNRSCDGRCRENHNLRAGELRAHLGA